MRLDRALLTVTSTVSPTTTTTNNNDDDDGGGGSLLSVYGVGSVLVIVAVALIFSVGCSIVCYCGWMNWKQARQMQQMKQARHRRSTQQQSGRSRTGTIEPINMAGQKRSSQRSILREKRGLVVAYESDSDSPTEPGGSHDRRPTAEEESEISSSGERTIPFAYRHGRAATVAATGTGMMVTSSQLSSKSKNTTRNRGYSEGTVPMGIGIMRGGTDIGNGIGTGTEDAPMMDMDGQEIDKVEGDEEQAGRNDRDQVRDLTSDDVPMVTVLKQSMMNATGPAPVGSSLISSSSIGGSGSPVAGLFTPRSQSVKL